MKSHLKTKMLIWALTAFVLGAVFVAYTRPAFMLDLANQIWLCF